MFFYYFYSIHKLCNCFIFKYYFVPFKNSEFKFKYNENAINSASENGHVHILEWFKNSGFEFKYNKQSIKMACKHGHTHILEWFEKTGL